MIESTLPLIPVPTTVLRPAPRISCNCGCPEDDTTADAPPSARCIKDEKESVEAATALPLAGVLLLLLLVGLLLLLLLFAEVPPPPLLEDDTDMVATADKRAASAPCESTIVVIQAEWGSGGNRTRVMIPGTTSEKYRDTKVDIRDDLPTPSGRTIKRRHGKNRSRRLLSALVKIKE